MRLSNGHLARIPHGAVKSQRPSLPRNPLYNQAIKLTIFVSERFTPGPLKRPLATYIFFIFDEGL